jgi:phage shock protein PspC (stress-responsive transcriptional regulator)
MLKQKRIRLFFERNGFAVSTRLAEVLGMKVKSVRLFFIYASFTTLIGGFLIYLTLAFWLKLKDMIYTKRSSFFDFKLNSLVFILS